MTKKLFLTLSIIALSLTFCLFFIPLSQATDDPPCTNGDCPPTDPPCTNGDCPPDPGCTNEDCPPDPGCTNEDCPPDPGCTNEDCPPDPGCTNEDCPPDYWNNCCCYEEYNEATNRVERICCCRDNQSITCRESYVISYSPPDHGLLNEIAIATNDCTDNAQQQCAPDWFYIFIGNYWDDLEESCSWWGDLQQCRIDEDGDGIPDDQDECPDTVIPESVPTKRLGTNRFALVDGDTIFDTKKPNGNGPRKAFTIEDTSGCSCEQIIEELGLGKGHVKFGCSISAMEEWIDAVNP